MSMFARQSVFILSLGQGVVAAMKDTTSITSTNAARTFHPFPKLPPELREAIWRLCLPHQVCELDLPVVELVYFEDAEDSPCTLADTSRVNLCPPMITQVCYEAARMRPDIFEAVVGTCIPV